MKIPKLKRFYCALTAEEYHEFELTRELAVSPQVTIDICTGQIQGRSVTVLASSAARADQHLRESRRYRGAVYVLYLPAQWIRRDRLTRLHTAPEIYEYRARLEVPHCGVERFELAAA